jgi:hypothetical protein
MPPRPAIEDTHQQDALPVECASTVLPQDASIPPEAFARASRVASRGENFRNETPASDYLEIASENERRSTIDPR